MPTRRNLLRGLAASLAVASVRGLAAPVERAKRPLRILVLGGTGFIGPPQVDAALARGHEITLFNRGKSKPGMFGQQVEILLGDRDPDVPPGLSSLSGDRRWDVVIDNSGYVPRHVRASVELLRSRVGRYIFVSTVAVYDPTKGRSFNEDSPLLPAPDPSVEKPSLETYGPLKAECDRIVRERLGQRATVVRPIFIAGPGDETDRMTYWMERMARGGDVLGPPQPDKEIQWVDVRDLGPWLVDLAERDQAGVFNAAGPVEPITWRGLLEELSRLSGSSARIHWATAEVLTKLGLTLPLAWPPFFANDASMHFDGTAARRAGLRYRPLADTVTGTLAWWRSQPAERRANARNWPSPADERRALELLGHTVVDDAPTA